LLLILTASCFLFVPYPWFINLTGEWFGVGWPFSTGALKIGYVSPESPTGIHPHVNPTAILNLGLWATIYFGLRSAAQHENLFFILRIALRVICYISVMVFVVALTHFIHSLPGHR